MPALEGRIQLDNEELDHWQWVPVEQLSDYVISRLVKRLTWAYRASRDGVTLYLEHGEPQF